VFPPRNEKPSGKIFNPVPLLPFRNSVHRKKCRKILQDQGQPTKVTLKGVPPRLLFASAFRFLPLACCVLYFDPFRVKLLGFVREFHLRPFHPRFPFKANRRSLSLFFRNSFSGAMPKLCFNLRAKFLPITLTKGKFEYDHIKNILQLHILMALPFFCSLPPGPPRF